MLLVILVGVYFTSCVETVKFVDFCGKYRVPLLQYLCSPRCRPQPQPRSVRAELQRQFSGSAGSESQAAGASGASADVANASSSSFAGPAQSEFSGLSTDSEAELTSPESKEPALSEAARSAQDEEEMSDRVRKVLLPF